MLALAGYSSPFWLSFKQCAELGGKVKKGERPMDDNYRWVYGLEEQNYGDATATEYMYGQFNADVAKIKAAMTAETK